MMDILSKSKQNHASDRWISVSRVEAPSKDPAVSLSKMVVGLVCLGDYSCIMFQRAARRSFI